MIMSPWVCCFCLIYSNKAEYSGGKGDIISHCPTLINLQLRSEKELGTFDLLITTYTHTVCVSTLHRHNTFLSPVGCTFDTTTQITP